MGMAFERRRFRRIRITLAVVLTAPWAMATSGPASATSCAASPDQSFEQMIDSHRTDSSRYDTFFLGKVAAIKDVDPGPGGDKIAKLAIAASPVGYAPLVTRVQFWKPRPPRPGEPTPGGIGDVVYKRGHFYGVVGHRLADGSFSDDGLCGDSRRLPSDRFRELVGDARAELASFFQDTTPAPAARTASRLECPAVKYPSYREMIKQGHTGSLRHNVMLAGKVVAIRDLAPGRGGGKVARIAIADSPVGYAPLVARVRFEAKAPDESRPTGLILERRGFYVLIAHHRDSGVFGDDSPCGRSAQRSRDSFWNLVRFAREH